MNSPLFIIQITDFHILANPGQTMAGVDTEYFFNQVLAYVHANHEQADLILVTGDLAQDPCLSSYQRIAKELEKYQTRTLCLPGNHDDFSLMQQVINSKHVNCNKRIEFEHWQIICLNTKLNGSQGGYLASDELDSLADNLKEQPELNTFIAVHHHPVPTNSPWMDKMIIKNNDELFLLLKDYPQVKVITCGHIHQELEIYKDKKLILGTPSTCFQFKPLCSEYTLDNSKPGYRTFQLYPDGTIKSQIYRIPLG